MTQVMRAPDCVDCVWIQILWIHMLYKMGMSPQLQSYFSIVAVVSPQ